MSPAAKYFTVKAELGDAKFAIAVRSDAVDQIVDEWSETADKLPSGDARAGTRQLVAEILMKELQEQSHEAQLVASALVWLAATGQYGDQILPLMRAGDMEIGYAISRIDATRFNFRQTVDEATGAVLGLTKS